MLGSLFNSFFNLLFWFLVLVFHSPGCLYVSVPWYELPHISVKGIVRINPMVMMMMMMMMMLTKSIM